MHCNTNMFESPARTDAGGEEGEVLTPIPSRIVLLHLDSLSCLPGLGRVFDVLGSRVGLVMASDRISGVPDLWRHFRRSITTSGLRMTIALGFDIVALRIAAAFAPAMRCLVRQLLPRSLANPGHSLRTLREHASRVGAGFVRVGNVNDESAVALLRQFQPDLIVSFHFDQILKAPLLEAVACPVVNVHPALLPAHRGPCPSFWTLAEGDKRCGVTVHRIVDDQIDAGEVLATWASETPARLCMSELDEVLFREGADALLAVLSGERSTAAFVGESEATYQTFPDRATVRAARRRGVRLWRLAHATRLIAALFGIHLRRTGL